MILSIIHRASWALSVLALVYLHSWYRKEVAGPDSVGVILLLYLVLYWGWLLVQQLPL